MRITEEELRRVVRDILREMDSDLDSQAFVGPYVVKGPGAGADSGVSKEQYCDSLASQRVSLSKQLREPGADVQSIQRQLDLITKTEAENCG